MNTKPIELILVARDRALHQAFRSRFDYLPNVTFANCEFEHLSSYDCFVSPANSFGMMDGGMDAAITAFFGLQLMEQAIDYKLLALVVRYFCSIILSNPSAKINRFVYL
jgi:hypothetical protein